MHRRAEDKHGIRAEARDALPLDGLERRLLNDYQQSLPLDPEPFAQMGVELGVSEEQVLASLHKLKEAGAVSRVGAVFRTHCVGASTLAAMAVPEERLLEVAELVNGFSEVNHNYEREHRFNLWFVLTAEDEAHLQRVLEAIEQQSGIPVMALPMLDDYHIDLGFDLQWK